jgi:hypothetical protein
VVAVALGLIIVQVVVAMAELVVVVAAHRITELHKCHQTFQD